MPLGAFLSGGIDSSAIVGIMAGELDRPVQTFTIGFEDRDGFDERPFARLVAKRHGTDHHEFVVHPDAVDLVERLVWHHDQPFGDSSAVPDLPAQRDDPRPRDGRAVGRRRRRAVRGLRALRGRARGAAATRRCPGSLQRGAGGSTRPAPGRDALRGRAAQPPAVRAALPSAGCRTPTARGSATSPSADRDALLDGRRDDWAVDDYRAIWTASEGARPLDRLLDLNLRTYLLDDLLVKADRMSMAHGLEVRSPFLDTDLLAYTARLRPRAQGARALAQAGAEGSRRRPAPGRDPAAGASAASAFRSTAGSARTCGPTSRQRSAAPDARVRRHLVPEAVDRISPSTTPASATTATRCGRCSRSRCSSAAKAGDDPAQSGRSATSLSASPSRVALSIALTTRLAIVPVRCAVNDSLSR